MDDNETEKIKKIDALMKELKEIRDNLTQDRLDIPYVPSSWERLKVMLELANASDKDTAADLGCGDGRVVIALARAGAKVDGFEKSQERYLLSCQKVKESRVNNVEIFQKDFFEADLSKYNLITIYGIYSIMGRLEEKFNRELSSGSRVISNYFSLPNWTPQIIKENVYLYIKK